MSKNLDAIRKKIDDVDAEIVQLLNERAAHVLEVRATKQEGNIDIYSPKRELAIIERVRDLSGDGPFPQQALERVFRAIVSGTRSLVGKLRVAYVGSPGAWAHAALLDQFGDDVDAIPYASISEVFHQVERGDVHHGVVPMELGNGLVSKTLALLMESSAMIVAETDLETSLVLGYPGDSLKGVKKMYGDAESLPAAVEWIQHNAPECECIVTETFDDALAIVRKDSHAAVVGVQTFVEATELKILARGLQNAHAGHGKYIVLGLRPAVRSDRDRTALLISVVERAGALRAILEPFENRGVTLTKIESRPLRNYSGNFVFYVEVVGNEIDPNLIQAFEDVRSSSVQVKVLGSYAAAKKKGEL